MLTDKYVRKTTADSQVTDVVVVVISMISCKCHFDGEIPERTESRNSHSPGRKSHKLYSLIRGEPFHNFPEHITPFPNNIGASSEIFDRNVHVSTD